jgi:hypothetical protein
MATFSNEDMEQAATEGRLSRVKYEQLYESETASDSVPSFIKVVIREVISDPLQMTDQFKAYLKHRLQVVNMRYADVLPRNTIVGQRVLADNSPTEPNMFFLPFYPSHLQMPCKPGEHVWVFFDSPSEKDTDIGWWMHRVVGFHHTDDPNHSHAPRDYDVEFYKGNSSKELSDGNIEPIYDFLNGSGETSDDGVRYAIADTRTIAGDRDEYENLLTGSNASFLSIYESVPRYYKRPGDIVFEGSNNQVIAFCNDRTASLYEDGEVNNEDRGPNPTTPTTDVLGVNSGMIDIVTGRGQTEDTSGKKVINSLEREELGKSPLERNAREGDPDFKNNRSRVLISSRTMIDTNFGLVEFNSSNLEGIEDRGSGDELNESSGDGAIAIKSDKLRLIARGDVVIYATGFTRDENGNMIEEDVSKWAAVCLKQNGDIVLKPGQEGIIHLGGEDAQFPLVKQNVPATVDRATGKVTCAPIISTMGGAHANDVSAQGGYAERILVK